MKVNQQKSRQQLIHDAAQSLMDMFASGNMPEAIALTIIRRNSGDERPSDKWSLGNRLLMLAQGTQDARGYRRWQQVGRYVREGTQAVWIVAPLVTKFTDENGKEHFVITGFKTIPVFRFEDTDGKHMDVADYTPLELPPFWDVAEKLGVKVQFAPLSGNFYGKYSLSRKEITLCSQDAFVYFHELAHAVHDLNRGLSGGQNPEQEIVAEMSAAVLCQLQDIHGYEDQAYQYLKLFTQQMHENDVIKSIMRVLSDVEAVVEKILTIAYDGEDRSQAQSA